MIGVVQEDASLSCDARPSSGSDPRRVQRDSTAGAAARTSTTAACQAAMPSNISRMYSFSGRSNRSSASAYIPNGVAIEDFKPVDALERRRHRVTLGLPLDKPVMLFVGRFVEQKGLLILRDFVDRFPECCPRFGI